MLRSGYKVCLLLLVCHCFWSLSEDKAREYIYILTYLFLVLYLCMCVYYSKRDFILIFPTLIQHYRLPSSISSDFHRFYFYGSETCWMLQEGCSKLQLSPVTSSSVFHLDIPFTCLTLSYLTLVSPIKMSGHAARMTLLSPSLCLDPP